MTYKKTKGFKAIGDFMKSVTHEVPTGPNTDVMKRKINPSFKKILKKVRPVNLIPTVPKMHQKALGDKLKKLGKK